MKRTLAGLGLLTLMGAPGLIYAQGLTGTGTYSGTVPETYAISNTSDGSLAGTLGDFSTLTIAKGSLVNPTPLQMRLRSNHVYQITAKAVVTSGITDGTASVAGTSAQTIKTGDIGFGFTSAIDKSGASVVGTRTDTINTGFDVHTGWPSVTDGHTPSYSKTLHDIYTSDTQILSGDRISASGDNSSSDNFLLITIGISTLPQYLTPGAFSGTVTFTIASA